jgi:hypothetical protein
LRKTFSFAGAKAHQTFGDRRNNAPFGDLSRKNHGMATNRSLSFRQGIIDAAVCSAFAVCDRQNAVGIRIGAYPFHGSFRSMGLCAYGRLGFARKTGSEK